MSIPTPDDVLLGRAGRPAAVTHPDKDAAIALQLRNAARKLDLAATEYEAMAAQKRALMRLGYGAPQWDGPA